MSELKERLNDFLDEQENTNDDRFKVENEQQANWALRKIKQYKDAIEKTNSLAEEEKEKIDMWAKQENESHKDSIDYFQSLLAEYAMSLKEDDPKLKTISLPNGKLQFRKQRPKWEYKDDVLVKSLKKAGMDNLIRVKEQPNKSDIKKAVEIVDGKAINKETGEVIEGITVTERGEAFGVKVE
ncbi:MAG TPA: host-nuclease inhibitor Gam family protein [Massilibacterium sp.]|nr:host-nuclease inhibitor Gam family protein [Massilibacterium sp.]